MRINIHAEELELFQEIHASGIPIHEEQWNQIRSLYDQLSIVPAASKCCNAIFGSARFATIYLINLSITNKSKRILRLEACRLEVSWSDSQIQWLRHPLEDVLKEYGRVFPIFRSAVQPCYVLNDRFGRKNKLYPGDCISGFLVGEGESPIPSWYRNREDVPVRLTVYAAHDVRYQVPMTLRIQRPEVRTPNKVVPARGSSLFSKKDKIPRLSADQYAYQSYKEILDEKKLAAAERGKSGSGGTRVARGGSSANNVDTAELSFMMARKSVLESRTRKVGAAASQWDGGEKFQRPFIEDFPTSRVHTELVPD